jgi:hypothetical protein
MSQCDACGWEGPGVRFVKGRGRADGLTEDVPWTMADHNLCRLCVHAGYEVHKGRINDGLVRMLNVVLAAIDGEKADKDAP